MGHCQAMARIGAVLPEEYEDTGGLARHACAEYARPGDLA
jgi:hypothetical protein